MTDFEANGLVDGHRPGVDGRYLTVTVDTEAFRPEEMAPWIVAMRRWAERGSKSPIRFAMFLAVEDVVRLELRSPARFAEFLDATRSMAESGCSFHVHNHQVFDPATGERPSGEGVLVEHVEGYAKRASFFYDTVRRHRVDLDRWMVQLVEIHRRFLDLAGIRQPSGLAFRAGGWDHGATIEDQHAYVHALTTANIAVDSSATRGSFGRDLHVGAPFGANVFALRGGVLEVAPSFGLNVGRSLASRDGAASCVRLFADRAVWMSRTSPGVLVPVIHFDHLFHSYRRGSRRAFSVTDPWIVVSRVDRMFSRLERLARFLAVRPLPLESVATLQP